MAGKVLNIKVCSALKLRSGLTGKYHAICHYSYNLPLGGIHHITPYGIKYSCERINGLEKLTNIYKFKFNINN